MSERTLEIPRAYIGPLMWLVGQSSQGLDRFAASLEHESLTSNVGELARRVATDFEEQSQEAQNALLMLLSMALAMSQMGITKTAFVSRVLTSQHVTEALKAEADLTNKKRRLKVLGTFLHRALESPAVSLQIKAAELRIAQERILHDAAVLSDVRPVFTEDLDGPNVGMVLHTLRLVYATQSGTAEFYIGVSSDDLQNLVRIGNRALAKEHRLRIELERQGWLMVEPLGTGTSQDNS